MMKLLAVVAVMGLVTGFVVAQETPAAKTLAGTVAKVADGKVTVKAGEKSVDVVTNDKTVVTVDGKEAKVADLKEGMTVTVTPAEGPATKIEAKKAVEKKAEEKK